MSPKRALEPNQKQVPSNHLPVLVWGQQHHLFQSFNHLDRQRVSLPKRRLQLQHPRRHALDSSRRSQVGIRIRETHHRMHEIPRLEEAGAHCRLGGTLKVQHVSVDD